MRRSLIIAMVFGAGLLHLLVVATLLRPPTPPVAVEGPPLTTPTAHSQRINPESLRPNFMFELSCVEGQLGVKATPLVDTTLPAAEVVTFSSTHHGGECATSFTWGNLPIAGGLVMSHEPGSPNGWAMHEGVFTPSGGQTDVLSNTQHVLLVTDPRAPLGPLLLVGHNGWPVPPVG